MKEPLIPPSRLLHCVSGYARWMLGVLLALWLLLALIWGGIHLWIVPRIGHWHVEIEHQARRVLGVPMSIAAISARSEGIFPVVELSGVSLPDGRGHQVLYLPHVVLTFSPRALLRGGVEQIYVDSPEIEVRRDSAGRIFIAGRPLSDSGEQAGGSAAVHWLLSQAEIYIHAGTLRWRDDASGAQLSVLTEIDFLLRTNGRERNIRLDATPATDWGERFTVKGRLRAPMMGLDGEGATTWPRWDGQIFMYLPHLNVFRPVQHFDGDLLRLERGHGGLRVWLDVRRGHITAGTVDMALADVQATLVQGKSLSLGSITGRLQGQWLDEGFELSAQQLQLATANGPPGLVSNIRVRHVKRHGQEQGQVHVDSLDLATLSHIANSLPLDHGLHDVLTAYAPIGLLSEMRASWHGPLKQPEKYQVRGRIAGLALGMAPLGRDMQTFGFSGGHAQFDLTQAGGRVELGLSDGALLLPGIFEEAIVPVQSLDAVVHWKAQGQHFAVQTETVRFATADAHGEARLSWQTADVSKGVAALPGVLDLSGHLTGANAAQVHRYLPLHVPVQARHYVRDAVRAGTADRVNFRVKGDLRDFPFSHSKSGEFRISAQVKDVIYGYVPTTLQNSGEKPWPVLAGLAGELVFAGSAMEVRAVSGFIEGIPQLRVQQVNATIADLEHPEVKVQGHVRGPLADMLTVVENSRVAQLTHGALNTASATGIAGLELALELPIDALERAGVRGSVTLEGNNVRLIPDAPEIADARGVVQFSETGFVLQQLHGRTLGGAVQLSGGMRVPQQKQAIEDGDSGLDLQAQGTVTAEGLRAAGDAGQVLGLLSRLAHYAKGSTDYTMSLGLQRGTPQLWIASDLRGLALDVPAPLGKTQQQTLAIRFENRLTPDAAASIDAPLRDKIMLELSGIGTLAWERDLTGEQPVVRVGAIELGLDTPQAASVPLHWPKRGVAAHVSLGAFDLDAWSALLQPSPMELQGTFPQSPQAAHASTLLIPTAGSAQPGIHDYLPTQLALRAASLTLQGRTLENVVAGISHQDGIWRANVETETLNGYLEYHPASADDNDGAGRLFARLARLSIPKAEGGRVNTSLNEYSSNQFPALDVQVQEFELGGYRLGRLEIEATNRSTEEGPHEWRLQRLNLFTPEATLTSHGNWALLENGQGSNARRTELDFHLDIRDAGNLLTRFGMNDVLHKGRGHMEGKVGWSGVPLLPDYPSMRGQINLHMQEGQFLKADPGLAKLLSVLSLQSLPRRLALDFRDVFSEGFAFDFVRGDVGIDEGVASTSNLQMKGVNAVVLMEGKADIMRETQQLRVVVVPEINAMTASLAATAINPVVGLGSFLAQMFLRGPLMQAATHEFRVDGTWAEPHVERVRNSAQSAVTQDVDIVETAVSSETQSSPVSANEDAVSHGPSLHAP